MDVFSAPFDCQAFDNLPLSLATPTTFSDKVPPKVIRHVISTRTSDKLMAYNNIKTLLSKIEKHRTDAPFLVLDSYTSLVGGCDSNQPELDLLETVNSLQ